MSTVKGFIFDFNGTLFFDTKLHIKCFQEYCVKFGLPYMTEEYVVGNILGKSNDLIVRENYNPDATSEEIETFSRDKEAYYRNMCLEMPEIFHLTEGACELLDYLKEHSIPVCIATGSPIENIEFYMQYMGLSRWFTLGNIVYCDGTFPGKPAPDIYKRAAAKIGLLPSECVVFEDGTSGLRSARDAGVEKIIAIYEEGLPSPVSDDVSPFAEIHTYTCWKDILRKLDITYK